MSRYVLPQHRPQGPHHWPPLHVSLQGELVLHICHTSLLPVLHICHGTCCRNIGHKDPTTGRPFMYVYKASVEYMSCLLITCVTCMSQYLSKVLHICHGTCSRCYIYVTVPVQGVTYMPSYLYKVLHICQGTCPRCCIYVTAPAQGVTFMSQHLLKVLHVCNGTCSRCYIYVTAPAQGVTYM
jgi:hypothetical protein